MALSYADVKVILREVNLRDKPEQMLLASPKATVPVLVLTDGTVVDESMDIVFWSLAASDPDGWLSKLDAAQLTLAKSIIEENDGEFKQHLDQYKYADRFPTLDMQVTRAKGEAFLVKLDNRLQQSPYLMSDKISFVDVAVFPFIRQFAHVDKKWFDASRYEYLQRWLETFLESKIFTAVMKKVPVWQDCMTDVFLND